MRWVSSREWVSKLRWNTTIFTDKRLERNHPDIPLTHKIGHEWILICYLGIRTSWRWGRQKYRYTKQQLKLSLLWLGHPDYFQESFCSAERLFDTWHNWEQSRRLRTAHALKTGAEMIITTPPKHLRIGEDI